jgi:hypothetical protein
LFAWRFCWAFPHLNSARLPWKRAKAARAWRCAAATQFAFTDEFAQEMGAVFVCARWQFVFFFTVKAGRGTSSDYHRCQA